jgi:hypothetical protein
MKRLMLAVAVGALLVPATAAAKEPSEAKISGPGFHKTLKMEGKAESDFGSSPIGHLTMLSGFFPAAVGQQPDPILPDRPTVKLGPKYTVIWTVPAGPQTHQVRQELYPYARGGALTYLKPGQPIFDMKTRGGWYRAYGLKSRLVSLGLPARAPKSSSGSSATLALLGIPGALLLGGVALVLRRHRS